MARKLTARFVETVKVAAGQKRTEFRDAAEQGLELRVTAAGAKSWALRYRRQSDGAKRTVTLGAFPAYSLDDAREWAADRKREIARGDDPAAKRKARKEAHTFEELANDWLEKHAEPDKGKSSVADDRSMLDMHINPEIGSMKAHEIKKRDVIALLDTVKAKTDGRNGKRRMTHRPNRVFSLVRAIFRWGHGRDIVPFDPTTGVEAPIKKEKARDRALSIAEIRTVWAKLETAPLQKRATKDVPKGERVVGADDLQMTRATALALQISLATGQRIGEVCNMAPSHVDLNATAPVWTIPGEHSKNGEPNRVPISSFAFALFFEAIELGSRQWVFPGAHEPKQTIDRHSVARALERSRKAIGIEHFRVHDLRRTAATRMAELGVSPYTISLVLNHISVRRGTITGKVYNQYSYDAEKREALEKWGAHLEKIVTGTERANVVSFPASAGIAAAAAI